MPRPYSSSARSITRRSPRAPSIVREARFPVIHTWEGSTDHDVDALLELGSRALLEPPSKEAAQAGADVVMWACTSGSFVYGWEGCAEQAGWVAAASGLPSSSTSLAFAAALQHLGLSRVSVAATYPKDVASHFAEFLGKGGITVTALSTYDVPSGEDAGLLSGEWVLDVAKAADISGAEALLIPDTALHTLAIIPELEATLGIPVLTANQVTAWQGLKLAGHHAAAEGLGMLFEAR